MDERNVPAADGAAVVVVAVASSVARTSASGKIPKRNVRICARH